MNRISFHVLKHENGWTLRIVTITPAKGGHPALKNNERMGPFKKTSEVAAAISDALKNLT